MSNSLESRIRRVGRLLHDHQVAYIFRVPDEFTTTPCDFFGFTACGRAILVEAKQVARTSLPISQSPGLAPHQWNALLDAWRANCLALIAWQRGETVSVFDMDIATELSRGRKSIPWDQIPQKFKHPKGESDLLLFAPYLAALPKPHEHSSAE